MDDLYIYLIKMPPGIHEGVCPCEGGYTIYLDKNLLGEQLIEAYEHALVHIENGDFWNDTLTTSQMEFRAHNL
jgi:hypothetical protein